MSGVDCPSCADERAAGAAFCEACGRPLTEAAAAARAPGAAAGADVRIRSERDAGIAPGTCPHCGTPDAIGADGYCGNCGMLAARPRDHLETGAGALGAAVTDRGRRHHRNEDAFWLATRGTDVDVVVCDGVSASFDPDVASATAVETAGKVLAIGGQASATGGGTAQAEQSTATDSSVPTAQAGQATAAGGGIPAAQAGRAAAGGGVLAALAGQAVAAAAGAVAELAGTGDPRRAASNPACTIVAACVRGSGVGYAWVGDSRAYWLPAEGPVEQLTEDDSWATHAISLGVDPAAAMRDPKAHAITAWLGADAGPVTARTGEFRPAAAGHLVVCSDGLWNYLTDPIDFADAVRVHLRDGDPIAAARALTAFANDAGGADNITVALIPVLPTAE